MGNMAHVSSLISLLDKADLEHEEYVSACARECAGLPSPSLPRRQGVGLHRSSQSLAAFEAGAGEPSSPSRR